ncbi:hypothetical protein A9O67_10735 [Tepidimonas fonticaldi]|uniref:Uncharacterized protein n=1 Tax=Tepidimonas fonticaldi TaxID=1101373 RepID=A0A1A6DYV7_9BURK|nr:hypothetical protein [Tepidimonas fonticaldi]OBS32023.1 hypothetical protein A9O67_10735 [Tepidimonas fonticaldi]
MNGKTIDQAKSADLRGSWPALLRAARRARELAAQTGTELIVMRDGVLQRIRPQPNEGATPSATPEGRP